MSRFSGSQHHGAQRTRRERRHEEALVRNYLSGAPSVLPPPEEPRPGEPTTVSGSKRGPE